jgi:1-acyl-sn-glycerol-3-phosphate acyltransferase
MPDAFYRLVRFIGYPAFALSASPTVLHAHRIKRPGPFIVAPNHLSPYDIPCLMGTTPRPIDFVSITGIFQNRLAAWFMRNMNAFPLDRSRVDPLTTRIILDRLKRGRVIAMFPEGNIRTPEKSLLNGHPFKPSVIRLARLANVPIIPCVMLATGAYSRASAWLPIKRTRYAINFGEAIEVDPAGDNAAACASAFSKLERAYSLLYSQLRSASGLTVADSPWRRSHAQKS